MEDKVADNDLIYAYVHRYLVCDNRWKCVYDSVEFTIAHACTILAALNNYT